MREPIYETRPQNSTLAVISLVAGILGLTFLPGIASIVAIITGYMAQKEIRESGGQLEGENQARIGLILGWVAMALGVIAACCALIFFIAVPFFTITSSSSSLLPVFFALAA